MPVIGTAHTDHVTLTVAPDQAGEHQGSDSSDVDGNEDHQSQAILCS